MSTVLAFVFVLIASTMATAETRPPPLEQLRQWLWPNQAIPEVTPPPAPPPAPPIVLPPPPEPIPPPPVAEPPPKPSKPKPVVKPKPVKPKPRADVRLTAAQCQQIANGIALIGRAGVIAEAQRRGYTAEQIARALVACKL